MSTSAPHVIDFSTVSTAGLESSPVADALAGLRANEARCFHTKHGLPFTTEPADSERGAAVVAHVTEVLATERDPTTASRPLEASTSAVDGVRWSHVFYASGLAVNVLWTLADGGKRAVGFELSDGTEVPAELAERFRFARQRSKLAGTIRGSSSVIKGEHALPA